MRLSTQVPAQAVYLSDGPGKTYEIGKRKLIFKKRALKESGFKHRESELVVQALKALGRDRIDSETRYKLAGALPAETWKSAALRRPSTELLETVWRRWAILSEMVMH